jgi:hypothetical protein
MIRALATALALVVFSAMAATTAAGAENGHTYHGTSCKAMDPSVSGFLLYATQGIYNNGSGSYWVACPILVDEVSATGGTTRVQVHWTANAAGDTMNCQLFSMSGEGTILQFLQGQLTGTGWLTLPNITSDDPNGSYALFCNLPRLGFLNTIWVGEQT